MTQILDFQDANKKYEVTFHCNKKVFHCLANGCGKTFKFKSEMKRHLAIHSNERPYICSICEKTFKRADALGNHVKLHDDSYYFSCTVPRCDARFQTRSSLQYHLLKHNNEKLFKCKIPGCTRAFITYAQLKQHEKASYYHRKLNCMSSPSNTACSTRTDEFASVSELKSFDEDIIKEIENFDPDTFVEQSIPIEFDPQPQIESSKSIESNLQDDFNIFAYSNQPIENNVSDLTQKVFTPESEMSVPTLKMDNNLVNMIQKILIENQDLKKKLEYTSGLLESNSIQTSRNNEELNVDKFFNSHSDTKENRNRNDFQYEGLLL